MLRAKAIFLPLLAGASLRDRLIACLGALIGIGFVAVISLAVLPAAGPWIVASIGASTVLLFAVPASPLAQPWPIVGGNFVSGATGAAMALLVPDSAIAAALAVSGAILAMSLLRCLHPPGGGVALGAVLAQPLIGAAGAGSFLLPVLLNSSLLVAVGWLFHRYSGHSYPHRPAPIEGKVLAPAPALAPGLLMEDIDHALADLGETFDIGREDLMLLLARAEAHAAARTGEG